uniref:Uncharacterized protein n=1 Tax=viral metagenome TaxID=1070528 RepID=A0A6C0BRS9_9ZZZZ
MEFKHSKLSKSEWCGIEIPVSTKESYVIDIIKNGWRDRSYKINNTPTIASYMKITYTDTLDYFIFDAYLKDTISKYMTKYSCHVVPPVKKGTYKMNSSDTIRFKNMDEIIKENDSKLYEFCLMKLFCRMLKNRHLGRTWSADYYTLYNLSKCSILNCNKILTFYIDTILERFYTNQIVKDLIYNNYILKQSTIISSYADMKLYAHQCEIFEELQNNTNSKLILYSSPTGTGKTLTPIGISEGKRVIFLCAARHVGIALARACISSNKKIAIAYGCESEDDIRLHYFAAKDFNKDNKSGRIRNVDNKNGINVEIMITDIGSYLHSMNYMMKFNDKRDIVLYWDEPTITMDYHTHIIHEEIRKIWIDNIIPNIVLSSATLPNDHELSQTFNDFKNRFPNPIIVSIKGENSGKSIPIVGPDGNVYAPHLLFEDHNEMLCSISHCRDKKTLLSYIDLTEVTKFIYIMHYTFSLYHKCTNLEDAITCMDDMTITNIKLYYLDLLEAIYPEKWGEIYLYMHTNNNPRYPDTFHVTTRDSHTLTYGPTICITNDVEKISNYCLKDANIPASVVKKIIQDINKNNSISKEIRNIESKIEDKTMKDIVSGNNKKLTNDRGNPEVSELRDKLNKLVKQIRPVKLPSVYIPNTYDHMMRYVRSDHPQKDSFTCDISEEITETIMLMDDIETKWKLLLLMGIGVFMNFKNTKYMEIMKELASNQKLYMIVAGQDFIYGTNYQFCHSFITKDLSDMTQEKIIQAIGRVGRNKADHVYSIRFRDMDTIKKIFRKDNVNQEAINMSRIFNSITI